MVYSSRHGLIISIYYVRYYQKDVLDRVVGKGEDWTEEIRAKRGWKGMGKELGKDDGEETEERTRIRMEGGKGREKRT